MPKGTTMAIHISSILPPLSAMSQKAGKAETAVISDPHKYTRLRPRWSDRRPNSGIVKHITTAATRSEEHTSELQSQSNLVCRLLLEKKKRVLLNGSSKVT